MPSQKKLGTLIFLLIISVCVSMPAFAFQNEPDGFRGIKWGTDISQLNDMVFDSGDGDVKYYSRKADKMKIGDTDIEQIGYGFYKNRFYTVKIRFSGFSNFTRLKASLLDQYGSGDKPFSRLEDYSWVGSTVSIVMNFDETFDKGKLFFFFKPISEEKKADEMQRVKKSFKDL